MTVKKTNEIIIRDEYAELVVKSPKYGIKKAIIDIDDVEKIKRLNYCWFLKFDNYNFYVAAFNSKDIKKRKCITLHRFITNCPKNMVIDHINHNTLDNRKCNLKICTQQENIRNQNKLRKDNKSGFRYIHWHKRDKKWVVQIFHKELFRTTNLEYAIKFKNEWLLAHAEVCDGN